MRRSSNAVVVLCIVSFVLVWIWFLQLELKAPALLFAFIQSVVIFGFVGWLQNARIGMAFGVILSALVGWVVSFITGIFLEWLFDPRFGLAVSQQLQAGTIFYQFYGWFVVSLMYLGVAQGVVAFLSFRVRGRSRKQGS